MDDDDRWQLFATSLRPIDQPGYFDFEQKPGYEYRSVEMLVGERSFVLTQVYVKPQPCFSR
jgi:hypothetical protein